MTILRWRNYPGGCIAFAHTFLWSQVFSLALRLRFFFNFNMPMTILGWSWFRMHMGLVSLPFCLGVIEQQVNTATKLKTEIQVFMKFNGNILLRISELYHYYNVICKHLIWWHCHWKHPVNNTFYYSFFFLCVRDSSWIVFTMECIQCMVSNCFYVWQYVNGIKTTFEKRPGCPVAKMMPWLQQLIRSLGVVWHLCVKLTCVQHL